MGHGNWSRGSINRPTCSRKTKVKPGVGLASPWRFLKGRMRLRLADGDSREADCRLTFGVLVQCPVRELLLKEGVYVKEEEW